MNAPHASARAVQEATGAITAQRLVAAIAADDLTHEAAWLRAIELAALHGWRSAALAAFVTQLAKLAAQGAR